MSWSCQCLCISGKSHGLTPESNWSLKGHVRGVGLETGTERALVDKDRCHPSLAGSGADGEATGSGPDDNDEDGGRPSRGILSGELEEVQGYLM